MADLIDEILGTSDEDIQYFSDIVGKAENHFSPEEHLRIKKTANFKVETQKYIKINHGRHEGHYVWHISPSHSKRSWTHNLDRVRYAIGKVLNDRMPHEIVIDIYLPDSSLGIDEITVRANDAYDHWSMNDLSFEAITGQFFEVLNPLV